MSIHEQDKKEAQNNWIINFKESYKKEMDAVHCPQAVQASAWNQMQKSCPHVQSQKPYPKHILRTAAAMAAVLCIMAGVTSRHQIMGFAESIFQSFTLSAGKNTMKLDPAEPRAFDQEAFCADPMTKMNVSEDSDGTVYRSYFHDFSSYKEMHQLTGFTLPSDERIDYKNEHLWFDMDFEHGYGHLGVTMKYQGTAFYANGMFVTDAYQQEDWGYGENDKKISEVYEYADGRCAYFFDADEPGGAETVYFVQDHIMFQLFVPKTENGRKQAKLLLEAMGR